MGESLGIIRVGAADVPYLRALVTWLAGWAPEHEAFGYSKERSEHEEAWQYMFTAERMDAVRVPPGLLFSECDTQADYARIRERLYPAILERDGASG